MSNFINLSTKHGINRRTNTICQMRRRTFDSSSECISTSSIPSQDLPERSVSSTSNKTAAATSQIWNESRRPPRLWNPGQEKEWFTAAPSSTSFPSIVHELQGPVYRTAASNSLSADSCVQSATRLAWKYGLRSKPLHEISQRNDTSQKKDKFTPATHFTPLLAFTALVNAILLFMTSALTWILYHINFLAHSIFNLLGHLFVEIKLPSFSSNKNKTTAAPTSKPTTIGTHNRSESNHVSSDLRSM